MSTTHWPTVATVERIDAPVLQMLLGPERVVINGNAYTVKPYWPNPPAWALLGYAGRHFVIDTHDGRRLHTNDLIFTGETTEPDTAVFTFCGTSSDCRCPLLAGGAK